MKSHKKKASKTSERIANSVAWGAEPKWASAKVLNAKDSELGLALNWYNFMSTPADQMQWTLAYLAQEEYEEDFIKKISKVRDSEIAPAGSMFRILSRGAKLAPVIIAKQIDRLKVLAATASNGNGAVAPAKPIKLPGFAEKTVESAMLTVENTLIRIKKKKLKAVTDQEMTWASNLTATQAKIITSEYQTWLDEHRHVLATMNGKEHDKDLIEAYSYYNRAQLELAVAFLERVVAIKGTQPDKPLVPEKKIPPHKLVAKVLYLEHDPETGIHSLDPVQIIGAQRLWIYNTCSHRLGYYVAKNREGLSVHRTTMTNYDESLSLMKVLRKPKEMVTAFMKLPDTKLQDYFNKLTTAAKPMNNRISRDIILLKVN